MAFMNRQGLYALLLLLQSASLPANFLCQASAAHQGHLDLRRSPMSPLRRYSNIYIYIYIYYVSFEEIQEYIFNNIYIYI